MEAEDIKTEAVIEENENDTAAETEEYDISELLSEDIEELRGEFSELSALREITELENPLRYAALRDLGLTPKEAYLATTSPKPKDNRGHLKSGIPHTQREPITSMTRREWQQARELFEDMSDSEIEKLYRKVTK